MAGWGAYTKALVNTKHVSSCSIHGLDGAPWAAEGTPKVSAAEAKALVAAFKDASPLRSGGMMAGGIKHIALACDADVLNGKKGAGGVCVAKSNKAIVVGMYTAESGIQAGPCSASVMALAADLKKKGF